jgi:hypothetical protein
MDAGRADAHTARSDPHTTMTYPTIRGSDVRSRSAISRLHVNLGLLSANDRSSVGADERRTYRLAAGALLVALITTAIFATAYIGALHTPTPHAVPIGVINTRTATGLEQAGDALAAHKEPNVAQLREDLKTRKIAAGLVGGTLFVASGESYTTAATLAAALTKRSPGLRVIDVAPLQAGDSRGTTLFYMAVALGFAGYFAATALSTLLGTGLRSRRRAAARVGGLAGFSLAAGIVVAFLADVAFGAIEGHFLAIAGIGALLAFAVGAATSALQAAFGIGGTLIAMVAFIMLGNSASGGAYQGTFTPGFWRAIGPYLPAGAGLSALKGAVYFDGTNIVGRLVVLVLYAAVGALVTVVLAWRRGLRIPELELAAAAAV